MKLLKLKKKRKEYAYMVKMYNKPPYYDEFNNVPMSKKEIEKMKEDIKRKREEQEAIDKLNQRVKKALEYQKQIEENKRAALEEEEEARKYQETLRIEKESQTKMAKEKEKVQSPAFRARDALSSAAQFRSERGAAERAF